MRIALVVPGGVDRSGEARVIPALLALLERLARWHEVHVFALQQEPEPGRWMLCGAHIHNIGGHGGPRQQWRTLAALLRQHRLAPFDLVHAIWSGGGGLAAVAAARLMRRPSLVHLTGGELVSMPDIGYGGQLRWQGRLREALTLRTATLVSATSLPIVALAAAKGIAARRVPLGVDQRAWPVRAPVAREPGQPLRLIHVASLNRVKDADTLLQALALLVRQVPLVELDIVGEDLQGGRVQALVQTLGLAACVRFHGFRTQAQLRPLFERAHLHVLSSRHEAGPMVALEAAVLGIPSVGTAVGHLAEWVPEAALAVPVGDAAALASAMARLAGDEALRLRLAARAQQRALAEDAEHTAACFEALYRELVDGHATSPPLAAS